MDTWIYSRGHQNIDRSSNSKHNFLRLHKNYGKNQYAGDSTKLTRRDRLWIFNEIQIGNKTTGEVRRVLELP